MNRRDRARQRKRKDRERRLGRQRHESQALPADDVSVDDDDPVAEWESIDPEDKAGSPEPPLFERHAEERLLRRIARALDRHAVSDAAERERLASALARMTLDQLDTEHGDDPIERAQDLAFRAWDNDDPDEQDTLLDEALRLDAGCTDACTLRALQERRDGKRLARLGEVIAAAGQSLGGEESLPRDGSLWLNVRARPYLRARRERLTLLAEIGRTPEAIAEGETLLEFDTHDYLLARDHLAGSLLEAGDLSRTAALLDRFEHRGGLTLSWARVLQRFLAGERREAALIRRVITRILPEVEEMILREGRLPALGARRATPVDQLAAEIYAPIARAWVRQREARRWLAHGAPETTAAERRAALESYGPPVAALLRLGEPLFGGPGEDGSRWPDYSGEHDLHYDDIPELLRMAGDPALHEQDPGTAAVWAPIHAWRALALFAAAGVDSANDVKDVLLYRLECAPHDDWTTDDAEHVLALVGEPAVDDLAEFLTDRNNRAEVRSSVAGALAAIGLRHPHLRETIIGTLAKALDDMVVEAEAAVADGYEVSDALEEDEILAAGLLVCGLMDLHAGTHEGGEDRVALVERAIAVGIATEQVCGSREEVLDELREC
jgi:hypothetical protein